MGTMLGGTLKLQLSGLPVCKEREEGTEREKVRGQKSEANGPEGEK